MTRANDDDDAGLPLTSVLVVDDHRMIAEALRLRLLGARTPVRRFEPVTTAYDLATARTALLREPPDVVLLDFDLAGENGLDLFETIHDLRRPPVSLILAAAGDPDDVIEGLTRASGWVSKGTPFDQLLVALETALAGRTYIAPALVGPVLDQLLMESGRHPGESSFLGQLSAREHEVLQCLVGGMSRQEVAEHLFISPNTVRTHVQNLLRHAEVHSTLALIATARDLGVTGTHLAG